MSLSWSTAQLDLVLPLLFALAMGFTDARSRRIPNYLTFGCALAGLGYQIGVHGLHGLAAGLLGMVLGFGMLVFFYIRGGMGAGDVKALAALGVWLGPWRTLLLFCYMAFSGVLLVIVVLWWRGLLWSQIKRPWIYLVNKLLLRSHPTTDRASAPASRLKTEPIPYAVAMAMGMVIICWTGFMS
jgi:prepilin peptidase CpaA